eukprot:CAMPEP_0116008718 /NCGR_PEP_ID=MMETSP0321-20121206/3021_1 /TAXON_ID=163516 /ORGANISM="Leptocylindrus danicus var. danicus, Strain B650" /LENGTH=528 /DNA_ID=CAMNT_0003477577 /DNA_START=100 /DNA_END=1686 /DNA_ORIENTATION=-
MAQKLSVERQCDFAIIYEEDLGSDLQSEGVSAFPTYVLYQEHGRLEGGRIKGANVPAVQALVEEKCGGRDPFAGVSGAGQSLGGGGGDVQKPANAEEARALRLARFGLPKDEEMKDVKPSSDVDATASSDTRGAQGAADDKDDGNNGGASSGGACETEDDAVEVNADVEMTDVEAKPELVDPTANLDKGLLDQLTSSMGFSLLRAQKGLLNGGGTAEGAVEWLLAHQDDADIDDPVKFVPAVARSYKCNECGKIFSSLANLELHASKTGHSDFEESTEAVKPLSPEEKAAKVAEIKTLLAAKRAEREEMEKVDNVAREKQRRFMGKEMAKTREEMEIEKRKRDALMRKREKEAARKERERIRAELAKDKAERAANKGKLGSRLGVDGYNPSAIQYSVGPDGKPLQEAADEKSPKVQKVDNRSTGVKVDECIKKISAYRAGGDGGKCLKILLAYVKNVAEKDEEKFKTINMQNKVYIGKVKPFLGAKALLLAVGFSPTDGNDALILSPDASKDVLSETKAKLEAALAAY